MRDVRTTTTTTNKGRQSYSANGCWMAEFRKNHHGFMELTGRQNIWDKGSAKAAQLTQYPQTPALERVKATCVQTGFEQGTKDLPVTLCTATGDDELETPPHVSHGKFFPHEKFLILVQGFCKSGSCASPV